MPFLAACPFCPNKVKVPDHLLGASLRCPRCGDYFTVAPEDLVPTKTAQDSVPVQARPATKPALSPSVALPPLAPPPPPMRVPPAAVDFTPASFAPEPDDETRSGWVHPWGGFAFFLAGVAWLLAAFALPRYVVLPLAGIGFLVSLAGLFTARERLRTSDLAWLGLGGGGNVLLLLLAAVLPSWLNNRWGRDFDVPEPDRNQQVLVSRDGKTVARDLSGTDWVEADKNAIRQGTDVLIRVESAVIDRLADKEQPALLVTLHVGNVGQLHDLLYHGQAEGQYPATAHDSRRQELPRRAPSPQAKKTGQMDTISLLPLHSAKDLLVFDAPWPGTEYVDLELPAAAWGREGTCKFRIPRTYILHKGRTK
jgi:hypothetical protein